MRWPPATGAKSAAEETFADFPPGWGPRMVVDQWFAAAGAQPRIGFEVNDIATMLQLVTHGLALGFMPVAIVGHALGVRTLPCAGRSHSCRTRSPSPPPAGPAPRRRPCSTKWTR